MMFLACLSAILSRREGWVRFVKDNLFWCKVNPCCIFLGEVGYASSKGGAELCPEKL